MVDILKVDQKLGLFIALNPLLRPITHIQTKNPINESTTLTSPFPTTTTNQSNILVKNKPLTPQPNGRKNKAQIKKPTYPTTKKKCHRKRPQLRREPLIKNSN
jgi:hypothetical protein